MLVDWGFIKHFNNKYKTNGAIYINNNKNVLVLQGLQTTTCYLPFKYGISTVVVFWKVCN